MEQEQDGEPLVSLEQDWVDKYERLMNKIWSDEGHI